jgi:micrococcal nuclease
MIPYISPTTGICHVTKVIDGDTLVCDRFKIRLNCIDAPEKSQAFGKAATDKLTQLVLNKNIHLVSSGVDIYGRVIAEVWLNNRFINAELVRSGQAYTYGTCPTQKTVLINAEKVAIANKLGVWQTGQIKPWNYRRQVK